MTINPQDTSLLGRLQVVAAQADPVPTTVIELARLAWETRALDAELLQLVADDRHAPVGVRAVGEATRVLAFEGRGLVLELQVEQRERDRRLVGQVLPTPDGARVHVEAPGAPAVVAEIGDLGDFAVEVPLGVLVRVRVLDDSGAHVSTGWIGA